MATKAKENLENLTQADETPAGARRVAEYREVTNRVVSMLAERKINVTQRGIQAYVEYNSDGTVKVLNLPYIPDDASEELLFAVNGFLDHEVAYVLDSDAKVSNRVGAGMGKEEAKHVKNLFKMLEDTRTEKCMRKRFPGTAGNLSNLKRFVFDRVNKKKISDAIALGDENTVFATGLPSLLYSWAGDDEAARIVKEADLENVLKDKLKIFDKYKSRIPNLASTQEAADLANEIYKEIKEASQKSSSSSDKSEEKSDEKSEEDAEGNSGNGEQNDKDKDEDQEQSGSGSNSAQDKNNKKDNKNSKSKAQKEEKNDSNDTGDENTSSSDADSDSRNDDSTNDSSDSGNDSKEQNEQQAEQQNGKQGDEEINEDEETNEVENQEDEDTDDNGDEIQQNVALELMDGLSQLGNDNTSADVISVSIKKSIKNNTYLPYTTDFDITKTVDVPVSILSYLDNRITDIDDKLRTMVGQMQTHMRRMFAQQSFCVTTGGHRSGRLQNSALHRLRFNDDRVFSRREEHTSLDTAITLLIDCSGSMNGSKIALASQAAYALSQTLERLGMAHEILGFTTNEHHNEFRAALYKISAEQMKLGRDFSRTSPIIIYEFKRFDEKLNIQTKRKIVAAAPNGGNGYGNIQSCIKMSSNADGESLLMAAARLLKRREPRKIMIVLSDGQPSAGGNHADLHEHLRFAVQLCEKSGIETLGIGIMDKSVTSFYPKNMIINNIEELPVKLVTEIQKFVLGKSRQLT